MKPLTPRERRLLALGILVAVLVLPYLLIAAPLAQGFADRAAQKDALSDQLDRNQRLVASASFWRAQVRRQAGDQANYALIVPNAGAAGQMAIARVQAAVQAGGGKVRAVREQPGPAGEVRLRVELELGLTQLVSTLKLLEDQKPCIVMQGLSIAADQAAAGRLSPMEVRIDLAVPYVVSPG